MRTEVKVTELNFRQWEHLTTQVPVNGREFVEAEVRVCVVFVRALDISELHIEMGVMEFATLVQRLRNIESEIPVLSPEQLPAELDQLRNEADLSRCKCGFRAPELGPHPACPVHSGEVDK